MEKSLKLEFEVLDRDRVVCQVFKDIDNRRRLNFLTEDKIDRSFCPIGVTDEDIEDFYRERVVPETRYDIKRVLRLEFGMVYYNAEELCRKSRGLMVDDTYWVRFPEDGNLSYEEAKKLVYEG